MLHGGTIDSGLMLYEKTQLTHAVSAGAEYAFLATQQSASATTILSNVKSLISNELAFPFGSSAVTVTPTYMSGAGSTMCCLTTSNGVTTSTCSDSTTNCPDGASAGVYLQVAASFTFQPLFPTDFFLRRVVSETLTGRVQ